MTTGDRTQSLSVTVPFLILGIVFGSWATRIPDVADDLALSEGRLGLVLLAVAAGSMVGMPSSVFLVGRSSDRAVTAWMSVAIAGSLALPAAAPSVATLAIALFLLGLCNGTLDIAMNALTSDYEVETGRRILTAAHGVFSAGGLLGAMLGAVIAGIGVDPEIHLAAVSAVLIVAALANAHFLPRLETHQADGPRFALPSRGALIFGVLAFLAFFGEGAITDWAATYLDREFETSAFVAALGYTVFALTMTVGRLTGDVVADRIGATTTFVGCAILFLGGALLIAFGPGVAPVVLGFAISGLGLSVAFPHILRLARATAATSSSGTSTIAAVASVGYLGFLLSPPTIGLASDIGGLRWGMALIVIAAVLLLSLGVYATRRASSAESVTTSRSAT